MKGSVRRISFFCVLLLSGISLLQGCTVGNTKFVFGKVVDREIIFDMGEYGECDKQKAYVYLLIAKAEYEEIFGNDVWDMDIEGLTMEEFVKNNALTELLRRESMSALALFRGCELSDDELIEISDKADSFYQDVNTTVLETLGITTHHIEEVFKAYSLSEMVYDIISGTVNTQISDSEAKVITVQYVKFSADAISDYNPEEQEDLYALIEGLADAEVNERDFCRGEVADMFGADAEKMVFALENGAISSILTIDGYSYIFKSINDYDEDKTEENKKVMLEKRKQQKFLTEYEEFMQASQYVIDKELWDEILISDLEVVK